MNCEPLVYARPYWASVEMAHLAAGREVFTLGKNAFVVVDIVLPAVLGLVHVREAGIEA